MQPFEIIEGDTAELYKTKQTKQTTLQNFVIFIIANRN